MRSATDFDIEDYRITSDAAFRLDFENAGADSRFALQDLRVGVEIEIAGLCDEATGDVYARSMKIDLDQFRSRALTAIISRPPVGIVRTDIGWAGELWADGQRIRVTPQTRVMFRSTATERTALKKQETGIAPGGSGTDDEGLIPLTSLAQVSAGMSLTYQGRRDPATGLVTADKVTVSRNDLEGGEARLWKSLRVTEKDGNALSGGELRIDRVGQFKLLGAPHVQEYVQSIGQSLVPAYQRELAVTDSRRIPFRWYVVVNDEANAFALANGTVIVNSGLLDTLDNEAQLAAIIGHEMAHATQEHTWRQMQFHKTERIGLQLASALASAYGKSNLADAFALTEGAIRNGYSRSLENQADRVGLEYMVSAGYDPREAPAVWRQMTKRYGSQATNFFWSGHDNNATRRSYLMNELRNNYQTLQYGSLNVNTEQFHAIQREAHQAGGKIKLRVR